MQTIETRIIRATGTKPTRIKATASGGYSRISSYNALLETVPNDASMTEIHGAAARAIMELLNWRGMMAGGATKNGMVWVFCDGDNETFIARK